MASYRPHYSVCKKMAMPRILAVAAVPEDVAYVPRDLKELAARAAAQQSDLHRSQLQADLGSLVQEASQPEVLDGPLGHQQWQPFVCKDRSCESLGPLKVGEFALFPEFRTRAYREMFSVNVVETAQRVLRFLEHVSMQPQAGSESCTTRYLEFLRIIPKLSGKRMLPPMDVAIVHFSHMLQSKEYRDFARSLGIAGLELMPHCCTWLPEDWKQVETLAEESAKLWQEHSKLVYELKGFSWKAVAPKKVASNKPNAACGIEAKDPRVQGFGSTYNLEAAQKGTEIFRITVNVVPSVDSDAKLGQLAAVVADDRDWFQNFVAAHSKTRFSVEELEVFQIAYQKYLYLLVKYPFRMERIGFAPNPSIDLMWHSHLLHPRSYFYDMEFLCFGVPHHKLLPEQARTEFVYNKHASDEAKIWEDEFSEPLSLWKQVPAEIPEEEW